MYIATKGFPVYRVLSLPSRMNIDRFANPNLRIPFAIFCGLWMALILGMLAGSGDFTRLQMIGAASVVAIFVLFFLRHIWVIGLLICFCAFYQVGFGFTMGDAEMSLVVAGLFFAMTWWRKKKTIRPEVLEGWSFGLLNTLMILWLAYVFGHTIFNIYDPYRPSEFAMKNLLKTVEGWTGPILLMVYFANRPQYISVPRNFPRRIAWLFIIALGINIAIRLFQLATGAYTTAADPNDPLAADYFTIPVLNLMENVFALRTTTPMAMLFCGAIIVTRWFKEQPLKDKRLFYIVMVMSLVGAVLSGGRGTLGFVLGLFAIFLVIQRRIGVLIGFITLAALLAGAANMMPGVLKSAPTLVRRSLNWALIERDTDTSEMIQGSSNWRLTLFERALAEWRSDPRIFWFGRATYSYGMEDVIAMTISGEDSTIESSLRRGTTHNLITDMLVTFGLVGLVLYFSLYFSLLFFLWTLYRNRQLDELARTFTLIILVFMVFNFIYAAMGGGNIPMTMAWFFIILIAYLYGLHAEALRAAVSAKIDPPKGPRFASQRPRGPLPAGA